MSTDVLSSEPIKDRERLVYVFVNQASPLAVMNLRNTGTFISPVYAAIENDSEFAIAYGQGRADFLPFTPNDEVSSAFMSPFTANAICNYRAEWDAEVTRRRWFPGAPSRLTAIFAFQRPEDCEQASRKHHWPLSEVRRFRITHVLRRIRVNMEIVSLARTAYARAMLDAHSIERLWRSYWSGIPRLSMDLPSLDARERETTTVETLWELLIDGRLDLDPLWKP
jgi:hypothetical protein